MTERVTRASAVPGWMTIEELQWLEQAADGVDLAIEFGSWWGRSSVALSAASRLVCVDTFVDQSQEGGTGEDLLPAFMAAVEPYANTVSAIRGDIGDPDFVDALLEDYAGKANLVFIDASHDEDSVGRDILLALKLSAEGAIVCGHDFSPAWPGVVAAVRRLLPGANRAADSIWWFKT